MSNYFSDFATLFSQINEGTVVLTPNKRLGRFVMAQYSAWQNAAQQAAWVALPCYSLSAWYQSLWQGYIFSDRASSLQAAPILLDATQETALWAETIENNSEELALFNTASAATVAKKACHSLVQFQCEHDFEQSAKPVIKQWMEVYRKRCNELGVVDFAQMVHLLSEAMRQKELVLPEKILLFAFDDIPPQLQVIVDIARLQGREIQTIDLVQPSESCVRISLNDIDEELASAARWAEKIISENPAATVGVIVPPLAHIKDRVETIFTGVFEPQYILPASARHASGFNISAATPLSQCAPIAAALQVLRLNLASLEMAEVNTILHSPFFGIVDEMAARALLASALREQYLTLSLTELRVAVGEFGLARQCDGGDRATLTSNPVLSAFNQSLQTFSEIKRDNKGAKAPSAWAEYFTTQLVAMGWPGERRPDTLEYQQVEIWREVIDSLCRFDMLFETVSLSQALTFLENIAFDTPFQAQTCDSSVQVLGLLEGAGLLFDYLWVVGMDSRSWPQPIKPNALIPLELQKRLRMPLASTEKELELAKKLTARFANSAQHAVFSYSRMDGDKLLHPSKLIEHFDEIELKDLNLPVQQDYWHIVNSSAQLETFIDELGPPIRHFDRIHGGTQIIKDQSSCAFKAFARYRLSALENRSAVYGLDASDKGSLIHSALEYIWQALQSHEQLCRISEDDLIALIEQSVAAALRRLEKKKALGAHLKELESQRLAQLLTQWMAIEKSRSPFTVVSNEGKGHISLGGLPIKIRYDRVDRLPDNSLFVLDYKTSKVNLNSWLGERPDEPQVPLYAIANKQLVSGAAFCQIIAGDLAYRGLAASDDIVDGVTMPVTTPVTRPVTRPVTTPQSQRKSELAENWQEVLLAWEQTMEKLAADFVAGRADLNPKSTHKSCLYCRLHSFCRVKERLDPDHLASDDLSDSDGMTNS